MIPSKKNIEKINKKKRAKKPKVHQKIANTFIENAIIKSNLSTLKTIYYLSTVLSTVDLENKKDDKIVGIRIDKRDMLKFTELSASTIIKTTKSMQQTSITFIDEKEKSIEGVSLLPRYKFVAGKNIVELDLYVSIAKMIVDVKRKYTNMNVKSLMTLRSSHSLRFLALLNRIAQYDENIPKRKVMNLDDLNLFFWNQI